MMFKYVYELLVFFYNNLISCIYIDCYNFMFNTMLVRYFKINHNNLKLKYFT